MIIPHAGGVNIGSNVEILSNCTIARGLGKINTTIGTSSKLDTQVHVGHGSKIGSMVRIASSVTISGSVVVGNGVWIGPNATISNGINVGDNSKITIGSTVVTDVEENAHVSGYFSINHRDYIKQRYKISKLSQKRN